MLRSTFQPLFLFRIPRIPLSHIALQRPPPVCGNAPLTTSASIATTPALSLSPPTSAYVHLPFCRKRCHYCDFPIVALGTTTTTSSSSYDDDPRISNYINLVLREIDGTRPKSADDPPLKTIFFGGGTPSLVPPRLVSDLLDALRSKFGVQADTEISMEMDPGTFDTVRLAEMVELGVNRVSLGVQAFQEELLRTCGRAHGAKEVHEAIEMIAGENGLVNWSMDLISSLPHQSLEMWEETLRLTIDARPSHVSVYDLQVEQGTKFGHLYTPGEFPLPTENQSADFYRTASDMLSKAGYEHYEISSYCKQGFDCKHNQVYWQNRSFYGFGLGAASYLDRTRFSRPRKMKDYANYVQRLEDGLVDHGAGSVDDKDMAMDVVMLSLRTAIGLDMRCFAKNFGLDMAVSIFKAFEPYIESRHVVALDERRRPLCKCDFELQLDGYPSLESGIAFIRLSDPDGFLLSNELISTAFTTMST